MSETAQADGLTLIKEVTRHLPCQLTDDEVMHTGEQLAQLIEDIATEESRASDVKAQLKASMTTLETRSAALGSKVRRREEYRDVKVSLYLQDDQMVSIVREDTGEQVEIRPAHPDELQADMEFEKEEAAE